MAALPAPRLNKILLDNEHCAYAAIDEGKLIGWIHAFYVINLESKSFVEIGGMVVDEYYRGKGIGKKLIEKVEGWAIQKECNRLRVRSNVKRKNAHKFYNRRGFIETKEQKIFDKQIK
jgi:GNAT superfamily N-acetyltransferase